MMEPALDTDERDDLNDATTIQSVVVTVRLLEALADGRDAMRVTELANLLGESKARVYRHLTTLRRLGLVDQARATERYRLGWKLFQLGQAAVEQFDLRRVAEPHMVGLRDAAGQTAVLAVPTGSEALVVACQETTGMVTITSRPGNKPPLTASAQGRIMLAYAPAEQISRILARKLPQLTPRTITDPRKLRSRLRTIRERLYEYSAEEVVLGINTIAAPLFDHDGRLVGTVGIVGSIQHMPDPPAAEQIGLVQRAAAAICEELNAEAYHSIDLPVAPADGPR